MLGRAGEEDLHSVAERVRLVGTASSGGRALWRQQASSAWSRVPARFASSLSGCSRGRSVGLTRAYCSQCRLVRNVDRTLWFRSDSARPWPDWACDPTDVDGCGCPRRFLSVCRALSGCGGAGNQVVAGRTSLRAISVPQWEVNGGAQSRTTRPHCHWRSAASSNEQGLSGWRQRTRISTAHKQWTCQDVPSHQC